MIHSLLALPQELKYKNCYDGNLLTRLLWENLAADYAWHDPFSSYIFVLLGDPLLHWAVDTVRYLWNQCYSPCGNWWDHS